MINLNVPTNEGGIYAAILNVLVGPLGPTGYENEEIPLQLDIDFLSQRAGMFGEKGVVHNKSEGDINYVPHALHLRNTPTSVYPNHQTLDVLYASNLTTKSVLPLQYGDLRASRYGYSIQSSGYSHRGYLETDAGFRIYTVGASNSYPLRVTASYVEVRNIRQNGTKVAYEYRTVSLTIPPLKPGINQNNVETTWLAPRSYADIMALVNRATLGSLGSFSSTTATGYLLPLQSVTSPGKMKLDILAYVDKIDSPDESPIELIDYGELAMRATAKVNANQVNMFAFLRDLRDVKSLIPKLKNFWQFKTIADNYLSVEYGILPTIDDLKSIVRALRGVKPYLDRNGFQVVTAVHNATEKRNDVTFTLEQRIKVAIDKEDEGLVGLVNHLDSVGFLLTAENLWDLVPYSFVVDWFLDIGELLERVDSRLRILRLGVRYTTQSYKRTASVNLTPTPSFPYSGTISLVQYRRWVTGRCPEPPLSLKAQEDFNHWIEATALLIQRSK